MTKRRVVSRDARRKAVRRTMFRRTTDPSDPGNRLIAVLIVFCMVGAAFIAVLVDLQAIRPEERRSQGEQQRIRTRTLEAYRGSIVDRDGFVLASSTPANRIEGDPKLIRSPETTAFLIAPILGVDEGELLAELRGDSESDRYALLAHTVSYETADRLAALAEDPATEEAMDGIFIRPEEDRIYPAGRVALPVVGQVDPDEIGVSGIEQQYDEIMTGVNGEVEFERGRFGNISVGDWKVEEATAGYDVILTLDRRIQFLAEDALKRHCESSRAAGATAVLTDPATSEVLAMATVQRNEDGECFVPGSNSALVSTFEPGSVLKTVTMAAAIEELGYSGETLVEVPPRTTIGGKEFVDRPAHPGAPYPVSQILADSMNVGTIQVAQQLGPTRVHTYLDRFGFGRPTGLDFKGEAIGTVREPEDWHGSDAGSIPIGQGVTVNATQLAVAYNVVANGGQYRSPLLVKALRAPDGTIVPVDPGPGRPVLSEASAGEVNDLLKEVVARGTGGNASIPGYQVAGKTGTAWKVFDDGSGISSYGTPGNRRYVVTFAGYAPADDPAISMVVVVDEPKTQFTASAVAAPVFAEIGEYALRVLGVAPEGADVGEGRVRAVPARLAGEEGVDIVPAGAVAVAPGPDADEAPAPAAGNGSESESAGRLQVESGSDSEPEDGGP